MTTATTTALARAITATCCDDMIVDLVDNLMLAMAHPHTTIDEVRAAETLAHDLVAANPHLRDHFPAGTVDGSGYCPACGGTGGETTVCDRCKGDG